MREYIIVLADKPRISIEPPMQGLSVIGCDSSLSEYNSTLLVHCDRAPSSLFRVDFSASVSSMV